MNNVNMVLLFFLIRTQMAVHTARTSKKFVKWATFDTVLRRVNFEEEKRRDSFPCKCGKAIFRQSRRLKSQKFACPWTLVTHGDTDSRKLVNLCPVKFFPCYYLFIYHWQKMFYIALGKANWSQPKIENSYIYITSVTTSTATSVKLWYAKWEERFNCSI